MQYWWMYLGKAKDLDKMWKERVVGSGKRAQRRLYLPASTIRQEQKFLFSLYKYTHQIFAQADRLSTND